MPVKGGHWSEAQREKFNRTIEKRREEGRYWTFDYDLRDEYDS
jgi:hypothetical protein